VAPPVTSLGAVVPIDLPIGYYSLSYSFSLTIGGRPVSGSVGPVALTNADGFAFATQVQGTITQFDATRGCGGAAFYGRIDGAVFDRRASRVLEREGTAVVGRTAGQDRFPRDPW